MEFNSLRTPMEREIPPLPNDGKNKSRLEQAGARVRSASMAFLIPSLLAAGPMVGYFLGRWIGGLFDKSEAGGVVGVLVGLVSGIREVVRLVRRMGKE
jgi:F0F1-type ATP synthase assembly protein I